MGDDSKIQAEEQWPGRQGTRFWPRALALSLELWPLSASWEKRDGCGHPLVS